MIKVGNGALCAVLLIVALALSACGNSSELRAGQHEISLRLSDYDPQQPALRYAVQAGDQLTLRLWSPQAQRLSWSDQVESIPLTAQQWMTLRRDFGSDSGAPASVTLSALDSDSGRTLLKLSIKPQ